MRFAAGLPHAPSARRPSLQIGMSGAGRDSVSRAAGTTGYPKYTTPDIGIGCRVKGGAQNPRSPAARDLPEMCREHVSEMCREHVSEMCREHTPVMCREHTPVMLRGHVRDVSRARRERRRSPLGECRRIIVSSTRHSFPPAVNEGKVTQRWTSSVMESEVGHPRKVEGYWESRVYISCCTAASTRGRALYRSRRAVCTLTARCTLTADRVGSPFSMGTFGPQRSLATALSAKMHTSRTHENQYPTMTPDSSPVQISFPPLFSRLMRTTALGLALLTLSCDWLLGPGEPEEVSVTIESDNVASAQIVTSQHFLLIDDPECAGELDCHQQVYIETADTTVVSLPFERSYLLNERLQFHTRIHAGEEVVATLSVNIKVDDREWYSDHRELGIWGDDGERDAMTFTYQYHEAVLPGT